MRKYSRLISMLSVVAVIASLMCVTAFARSAADCLAEAAACSEAWHGASTQAERDELHDRAVSLREEAAILSGGTFTYDAASGSSTVTNSSGTVISDNSNWDSSSDTGNWYSDDSGYTVNVGYGGGSSSRYGTVNGGVNCYEVTRTVSDPVTGKTIGTTTSDVFFLTTGGNGDVGFASDYEAEARQYCQDNGIPINGYNLLNAMAYEHFGIRTTADISAGDNVDLGMGVWVNGDNSSGYYTAANSDEGMSSFAGYLNQILDGAYSDYDSVYKNSQEFENTDLAIRDAKDDYMRIVAIPDDRYEGGAAQKAADLEAAHKAAEDRRSELGYTAGDGGNFYIPVVPGGQTSGFEVTLNWDPDDGDFTPTPGPGTEEIKVKLYPVFVVFNEGGTVTPGTGSFVEHTDPTFTIKPDSGYTVDSVEVDGTNMGHIRTYTIISIDSSHTIKVTFKKMEIKINNADTALSSDMMGRDGTLKTGYGIEANLDVFADGEDCTVSVTASYDWGQGKRGTVNMEQGSGSNWVFPVDTTSPTRARKLYVPVATKDGTYNITFTATISDDKGNSLSDTKTVQVVVKGTMYEDDFTGDRR